MRTLLILSLFAFLFVSCQSDPTEVTSNEEKKIISETFGSNINLDQLPNYASQTVPGDITRNNTGGNAIVNEKALIGRVLFYDKNLSTSNTVACASCHQQSHAFSDASIASTGVNGTTGRHSMRLVNARFAAEARFFWDERAATLEAQTTQPI